ncbi:MAG: hypothetical protein CMO55_00540 [Verrucomicrobiales bacterium]|nr:hypothetical protein [Verrucomicrobiales bacterium]
MGVKEIFFTSLADSEFQLLYERFGNSFYQTVDTVLEQLRNHPESGPIFEEPVRRILIPSSPFGLFYAIHGSRIAVVALLDLRQDPKAIRRRLQ